VTKILWRHFTLCLRGYFGPHESASQLASRSVQPFCRAYGCVQHTDTQQTTPRHELVLCYIVHTQGRPQNFFPGEGIGGGRGQWLGGTMTSAEHEPITGVWGQSPQRGPGAEALVRGFRGRSPPEAKSILVIGCPTEPANLAPFQKCLFEFSLQVVLSKYSCNVHLIPNTGQ